MEQLNSTVPMPEITYPYQIDRDLYNAFIRKVFSAEKGSFLIDHGAWWYGGNENQWLLQVDHHPVGYCAVIPTKIHVKGDCVPALWWVDLIIDRAYRGRGFQTVFDNKIRNMHLLTLGVPNLMAAAIHRKHGWGVSDSFHTRMFVLRPTQVKSLRRYRGLVRFFLTLAAIIATPIAWLFKKMYKRISPKAAYRKDEISPLLFADIFRRYCPATMITTWRDAHYFSRRFNQAPYKDELHYYVSGSLDAPTHYLISRHMKLGDQKIVRILDMFGDFNDLDGFRDMLRLVIQDADDWRASQITVMNTYPSIKSIFSELGFWIGVSTRLCWNPIDHSGFDMIQRNAYFTLADSDNDAPD